MKTPYAFNLTKEEAEKYIPYIPKRSEGKGFSLMEHPNKVGEEGADKCFEDFKESKLGKSIFDVDMS